METVSGCRLVVEDGRRVHRPSEQIAVLRRQPRQHLGNGLHEGNRLFPLGAAVVDAQIQLGPLDLRLPADVKERRGGAVPRGHQDRIGNRAEKISVSFGS